MDDIKTLKILDKPIKNTYIFTVIDKQGKVVKEQTVHNLCKPKFYYETNTRDLSLKLGTLTEKDVLAKYADKDGNWLPGSGGGTMATRMVTKVVNGKEVSVKETYFQPSTKDNPVKVEGGVFNRSLSVNDYDLWGHSVYSTAFSWKNMGNTVSDSIVTLVGEAEWGYHDPGSADNLDYEAGESNEVVTTTTVSGETETHAVAAIIKGIKIIDGALFGGVLLSHFKLELYKRPTDKIIIKVIVEFSQLPDVKDIGFTPFINEGSLMYAHSCNTGNGGTCQLKPYALAFSGQPLVKLNGSNKIIPITNVVGYSNFYEVKSDTPNDWDVEKKGPWRGYPRYLFIGDKEHYKVEKTVKEVDGKKVIEEQVYRDDKNCRSYDWSKLEEEIMISYGSSYTGPLKNVVLVGYGVMKLPSVSNIKPIEINIGTGDGKRKYFYHPFSTDEYIITTTNGGSVVGYRASENPLSSQSTYIVYDNSLQNQICLSNDANNLNPTGSQFKNESWCGYSSDYKRCNFSLHPFREEYLPYARGSGWLVGNNEWIVYPNFTGTIGSAWIGMVNGGGAVSDAVLKTAATLSDLLSNKNVDTVYVPASSVQHDPTVLNFQSKGVLAVHGGNGWVSYGYVGGLSYSCYDRAGIRFSSSSEISGYVYFSSPPPAGTNIYIQVTPRTGYFCHKNAQISGSFCFSYGTKEFNGREIGE